MVDITYFHICISMQEDSNFHLLGLMPLIDSWGWEEQPKLQHKVCNSSICSCISVALNLAPFSLALDPHFPLKMATQLPQKRGKRKRRSYIEGRSTVKEKLYQHFSFHIYLQHIEPSEENLSLNSFHIRSFGQNIL